jgi:hypothetical protein
MPLGFWISSKQGMVEPLGFGDGTIRSPMAQVKEAFENKSQEQLMAIERCCE